MESKFARVLSQWIRFNTVTSQSNRVFALYFARLLKKEGFQVTLQQVKKKGGVFMNVAALKGKGARPFMLCSHMDTVPAGEKFKWTKTGFNPWKAKRRGNFLYGLGSADDKGPLLAMFEACKQFPENRLKRPLLFLATFGEESGMGGAKLFIRSWKKPKPIAAIAGEPTSLGLTYRHKGLGVIEIQIKHPKLSVSNSKVISFKGKQAHSSRPHTGDNALVKAITWAKRHPHSILEICAGHAANIIPGEAKITVSKKQGVKSSYPIEGVIACFDSVQEIIARYKKQKDTSFYPAHMTSNFGILKTHGNQTTLVFDFRLLPGQKISKIKKELLKKIKHKLKGKKVHWSLMIERQDAPLGLQKSHAFVRQSARLLKENKLKIRLSSKPSCTEAGTYEEWGVPAVVFGPGKAQGNIHAPNEKIDLRQIQKAIQYYISSIEHFAGTPV